jgi:hypothetical protein
MKKMTMQEIEDADAQADVWTEEQRIGMWDMDTTENKANSATESL